MKNSRTTPTPAAKGDSPPPALLTDLSLPVPTEADRPLGSPLYGHAISAGFPSPAEDYIEDYLDLHKLMVHNPPATFFLRVKGTSMIGAGIGDGDLLVVDRSLPAVSGKIVVAALDGELTVKKLIVKKDRVFLAPANDEYQTVEVTDREDAVIWGVVTFAVRKV
jgi:DNA polymerase V